MPALLSTLELLRSEASQLVRSLIAAALVLTASMGLADGRETAGTAMIWQPIYDTLEVFTVNADGGIRWVYKERNGRWHQPRDITGPDLAVPGGAILPLWSVQNDQLEVFWVDSDGAVNIIWKDHNGPWHAPAKITGPGFALPGAPLAGLWQPRYHHLEVFGIAADGALSHVYKTDNKRWNPAGRLFGPGFGVPGSRPFAIYQPTGGQSQVFAAGPDGAINLIWKPYNETWKAPFPITRPGIAPPGAAVSAVYASPYDLLEVFFIDHEGAAVSAFKHGENIYGWKDARISPPGFAIPGSPLTAIFQDSNRFVEIFAVNEKGAVNGVWKASNGPWAQFFEVGRAGIAHPGNAIAATVLPGAEQLEVVWQDGTGAIWDAWKSPIEPWSTFRLTDAAGDRFITAGLCSVFFNNWRDGHDDDYMMTECSEIMGINAHCAESGAIPMMTYGGPQGNDRWLVCVPRYRQDSIGEQAERIAVDVKDGLNDALVAASPYLGPAIEAYGCLNGVVYACAALALDILDRAIVDVPPEARAALSISNDLISCIDGDVAACVTAGKLGYKTAVGHEIPGGDLIQIALDARECREDIFAACARMGQAAAEAAGIPKGVIPPNLGEMVVDAEKCLDTLDTDNHDACVDLGRSIAEANDIPYGDILNGLLLADRCVDEDGIKDADACRTLGERAARVAGVPVALATSLARRTETCWGGDTTACLDIAAKAMRGSGVPLHDIALVEKCAARDVQACTVLGTMATGIRYGDATTTAQMVSDCAGKRSQEGCIALARRAINSYAPESIRNRLPRTSVFDLVDDSTLHIARTDNRIDWGAPQSASPAAEPEVVPPASVPILTVDIPPVAPAAEIDPRLAMPTTPSPAAGVSFTGDWVSFVRNGVSYRLTLSQDSAGRVSGRYEQGTITRGVVVGRELYAVWTQGNATGTLLFRMAPDSTSFAGMWTQGSPDLRPTQRNAIGSWDGYSATVFTAGAGALPARGRYVLSTGDGTSDLEIVTTGSDVRGRFGNGQFMGTIVQQSNRPTELRVRVNDRNGEGEGRFFLYPNGGGFSGFWHIDIPGLNAWSGQLVGASAPPQDPGTGGPGAEGPGQAAELPPATVPVTPTPVTPAPVTPAPVTPAPATPAPVTPAPVPLAEVPQGQCPAPTARVTEQLNIRDGASGEAPILGRLPANTRIQCLACNRSWCLFASDNPRSTVSRRYLEFEVAAQPSPDRPTNQGQARPGPTEPTPATIPDVDFTGRWTITSDKGWTYYFRFNELGSEGVGVYIDQAGYTARLKGTVSGNTFDYTWDQDDGYAGSGTFTFEGDRVTGTYLTNPDPRLANADLRGTWGGQRSAGPAADFSGPWFVTSTSGVTYNMQLSVDAERVSGTYTSLDQSLTGSISGWVTGNLLAYEWTQPGGYSGGGVFVLNGEQINGPYHARPHPQLDDVYRNGHWGGPRGGGGGKATPSSNGPDQNPNYGACPGCDAPVDDLVVK